MPEKLSVSVIIPAFNEAANIARLLESLRVAKDEAVLDVIVADNGSTDNTVGVAQSYSTQMPVRVLSLPGLRISALRNAAAREAGGELLAFIDADCSCRPGFFQAAARMFREHPRAVLGSKYLVPDEYSWIARTWYAPPLSGTSVSFVPAGNMLIGRDVFREIGGFDESIQTNEDCELCLRARKMGVPVVASLDLGLLHWGTPQSLRVFYRKTRWHGTHVFKVFFRNLSDRQNLKPVLFAVITLAFIIAALSGVYLLFAQRSPLLLLMSLGVWLLSVLALGFSKAMERKRLADAIPLSAMFFIYGIARAESLVRSPFTWNK